MNCAIHSESAATGYCRTCGKPMCDACKRTVRGIIYCEDCIASRIADPAAVNPYAQVAQNYSAYTPPRPHGTASPGLAAVLGFIPGVGAMYNGQFMKALIHVLLFAAFIWMADHGAGVFFGLLIPLMVFYMVFDAYKTARARELGEPLPDPFGLERMFGSGTTATPPTVISAPSPEANANPVVTGFVPPASGAGTIPPVVGAYKSPAAPEGGYSPATYPPEYYDRNYRRHRGPGGAVVLIILGIVFLVNTMGFWNWNMGRYWPVILIGVGVWLMARRLSGKGYGNQS